jgi:type I restriction enzyme S subunit
MTNLDIPNNWSTTSVRESCTTQYGCAFDSDQFTEEKDRGMPVIRIGDLGTGTTELNYTGDYEERYVIEPGDFLISMDRHFHIYEWNGDTSLLNQRVCKIKSNSESLLDDYLKYYMEIPLVRIKQNVERTTVPHLSKDDLEGAEVPLPPLDEQERIVKLLDRIFERVENVKKSSKRSQEIASKIMYSAVDKLVVNNSSDREWMTLSDVADRLRSTVDPSESPETTYEYYSFPAYDEHREPALTNGGEIGSRKRELKGGELMISRLNPRKERVWKVSESDREKIASTEFVALELNEDVIDRDFLYHYLNSKEVTYSLVNQVSATTKSRQRASFSDVMELSVPVPPLEEQESIADRLDDIKNSSDSVASSVSRAISITEQLPRSIRIKAFSGELTGTDIPPEDIKIKVEQQTSIQEY